jgi:hypothetical protein
MKNKVKKNLLIVPILFLLIAIAAFLFLYREIKNNTKTTNELSASLQTEVLKRNEIKTLNNYFQSIETEKAELETHFIQSSNVVPFLDTLENLASRVATKTEVSSINVAKDNTGLVVEMKNTGTFPQIYKFITLLENAPYELEFLSVDMHKFTGQNNPEENVGADEWEAVIRLKLVSFI